jgi:anti-sigma B factor antagonist
MYFPETVNVHRRDYADRTLVILVGEVDLASAAAVRESLVGCLRDGVRVIDVDMASVDFCDCLGLGIFVQVARRARRAGGSLRLHSPTPRVARLISLTRTGSVLLGPRPVHDGEERPTADRPYGEVPLSPLRSVGRPVNGVPTVAPGPAGQDPVPRRGSTTARSGRPARGP